MSIDLCTSNIHHLQSHYCFRSFLGSYDYAFSEPHFRNRIYFCHVLGIEFRRASVSKVPRGEENSSAIVVRSLPYRRNLIHHRPDNERCWKINILSTIHSLNCNSLIPSEICLPFQCPRYQRELQLGLLRYQKGITSGQLALPEDIIPTFGSSDRR